MYRFFKFLSDYLLLSACCTFLVSILTPFFVSSYYFPSWGLLPVFRDVAVVYWSYKAFSSTGGEIFLNSYWFNNADPALASSLGISWILVAIFLLQVFTLASGIFSLLKTRNVRIIPFGSSAITVVLMIQAYAKASARLSLGLNRYQTLGYWLTYPSIFLFLGAFIFHLVSKGKKTIQYTPIHIQTQ